MGPHPSARDRNSHHRPADRGRVRRPNLGSTHRHNRHRHRGPNVGAAVPNTNDGDTGLAGAPSYRSDQRADLGDAVATDNLADLAGISPTTTTTAPTAPPTEPPPLATPSPTATLPATPPAGAATPTPGLAEVTLPPVAPAELPGLGQRVTFLLLGIDRADSFEGNTDVIMLVSLDPVSSSAFVLSIPRDLCLGPCDRHSSRINEILRRQGMEALHETLYTISGLPIDYVLLVNFYGVERIIDSLGGVHVWSPREFDERFVYLDTDDEIRLVLEPGLNTLNGREAVAYGRSRKYDAAGDFARICRQQQVMRGLRDQALSPALIVNIPAIIEEMGGAFRTDFPLERLPSLAELALQIPPQRVHSFAVHSGGAELLQWVTGEDGAFLLRPDLVAIRDFVADAFERSRESPTNAAGEPIFIADNCEAYYPS